MLREASAASVVLAVAILLVACGSGSSSGQTSTPTSGTTAANMAAPATASPTPETFGPLAVMAATPGRSLVGGPVGPISIGDDCVTMMRGEELITLVWRSDDVVWDADQQTIIYRYAVDPQATPITIQDGDVIHIGGILGFPFGGGEPTWLATPAAACAGERFFVESAELGD